MPVAKQGAHAPILSPVSAPQFRPARMRGVAVRFLLRSVGYLLLAVGFIALVIDGARSIANSALLMTPLGETLFTLIGPRYLLLQPMVERGVHPLLWDPVLLRLTLAPTAAVALLLGFLLLRLGARREAEIGIVTRR